PRHLRLCPRRPARAHQHGPQAERGGGRGGVRASAAGGKSRAGDTVAMAQPLALSRQRSGRLNVFFICSVESWLRYRGAVNMLQGRKPNHRNVEMSKVVKLKNTPKSPAILGGEAASAH